MSSTHCTRCESPLESGDLRCAICGQVPPVSDSPVREQDEFQQVVLRCGVCGAATRYDAALQALSCSFCAGTLRTENLRDVLEQTEGYLPFTVTRVEAREALGRWLGSLGFFRPADLKSKARIEDLRPLWWVGWVFDAEALVSWTADSNAGSRQSDWAPHSGQDSMVFDDVLVSASRGLSAAEAYELASSYAVDSAQAEPGHSEEGAVIEAFDVQRSQARRIITDRIHSVAASHLKRGAIPGSKFRNVHVQALLTGLETRRLSFPAWIMAYRYKDKLFRVVISGQDATCLKGKAPVDWSKIALLVLVAVGILGIVVILASLS